MTAIRFANAVPADARAIKDCIAAAYSKVRESIDDLPDVTAGIPQEIAENQVVLAWTGADLGGVIIYAQSNGAMKVINLAVSPKAQGQGIAGKLLKRAEDAARQAECTHMELRTHRQMQDTRAIYAHLGWRETEVAGNSVAMIKEL
ncbi:GNAT family N-acetyltransferase [Ruegeria sp.]|uniref:GNAT family N-acetyltransferase n=1 Tax=Ruegeria sp. TaxID=1879320 RepID=UPI003B59D343